MKDKSVEIKYFKLLNDMKTTEASYHELDNYKDRYTDFEFKVRKQLCKDIYTEANYAFVKLIKQLPIRTRFKLRCLKWLKKLQRKKNPNRPQ
jgi:hypothetical protein